MSEVSVSPLSNASEEALAIQGRLATTKAAISREAVAAGRSPSSVRLVCVSKNVEVAGIEAVLEAGERCFGENRVQEAKGKWPALRQRYPDLELHLIGPLQTNKVREALQLFDVIETLDRPKLAEVLAQEISRSGLRPRLFVEVNIGSEPQKAGILPDEADAFIATCRDRYRLTIDGLMCIPPAEQQASPYFALLGTIARRNGIAELSMGMSADYPLAVQLGATYVRVGTAIFGARAVMPPVAPA